MQDSSVSKTARGKGDILLCSVLVPLLPPPPLSPECRERSRNCTTVEGNPTCQALRTGSQQMTIELHRHPPPAKAAAVRPQTRRTLILPPPDVFARNVTRQNSIPPKVQVEKFEAWSGPEFRLFGNWAILAGVVCVTLGTPEAARSSPNSARSQGLNC